LVTGPRWVLDTKTDGRLTVGRKLTTTSNTDVNRLCTHQTIYSHAFANVTDTDNGIICPAIRQKARTIGTVV
jgi:hypothetical protein